MIEGEPPSPRKLPSGCAFRTRCPARRTAVRSKTMPALEPAATAHDVACLRWREIGAGAFPSQSAASPMGAGAA